MVNLLISGINGRLGKVIYDLAIERDGFNVVAGFDISKNDNIEVDIFTDINKCNKEVDVIIDFSHPAAFDSVINYSLLKNIPVVMATTGLSEEQIKKMHSASEKIGIFSSANMSLGINLLIDLVQKAATILEKNFDIEVIEKHHNQKIDAPSGTALAIADSMNEILSEKYKYVYERQSKREKRTKKEIGLHALRGGTIVGEHDVIFAGTDEIIEIKHKAMSKNIFASGALDAAKFMKGKKSGFYNMNNIINK
ncbi:MAG: 4-hydroxy-tetrahydrodipicolinate reductase [Clostridiales bacterium]